MSDIIDDIIESFDTFKKDNNLDNINNKNEIINDIVLDFLNKKLVDKKLKDDKLLSTKVIKGNYIIFEPESDYNKSKESNSEIIFTESFDNMF